MIDRFALEEIVRKKNASEARVAVYDQLSDFTLVQARASVNADQLDVAAAWMEVTKFCLAKMDSEADYLQELRKTLYKAEES